LINLRMHQACQNFGRGWNIVVILIRMRLFYQSSVEGLELKGV
jgi:hypothetical protein